MVNPKWNVNAFLSSTVRNVWNAAMLENPSNTNNSYVIPKSKGSEKELWSTLEGGQYIQLIYVKVLVQGDNFNAILPR